MKRILFLSLFLLLAVTIGNAQQHPGIEVSVSSGVVLPSSPMAFANYWNVQYGGGLRAGYPLTESITFVGEVEYYQFKLNQSGVANGFDTQYIRDIWIFKSVTLSPSADQSTVTTVSANMRVAPARLGGILSPYFIGGIGVMRFSLSEIKLPTTSVLTVNGAEISMTAQQTITGGVQTSAFFQFGMGFDIPLTQSFDLSVEARYASGLTNNLHTAYVPITGGIKLHL
jgi:opacity protein-like surface antigen